MSKCFCILPFIHQEIQQDGNVYACCRAQIHTPLGNTHKSSAQDLWNCDQIKQMRLDMQKDIWPKECHVCEKSEEMGSTSMREYYNEYFRADIDTVKKMNPITGELPDYQLKYIGIRHSNLCNFACIYCDHNYSTRWAKLNEITYEVSSFPNKISGLIKYVEDHLVSLEKIYIAGGEPLVTPDHLELLEFLVEKKKSLWLIYNTNLSSLKINGKDLIPIWKKFKRITLSASIDDMGERFEFIRFGGKWDRVEKNIKEVLKNGIELEFYITVTNLNVFYLSDFLTYLIEELNIDTNLIEFNMLEQPSCYSINNLNKDIQDKSHMKLNQFIKKGITSNKSDSYKILLPKIKKLLNYLVQCRANECYINEILKADKNFDENKFRSVFKSIQD